MDQTLPNIVKICIPMGRFSKLRPLRIFCAAEVPIYSKLYFSAENFEKNSAFSSADFKNWKIQKKFNTGVNCGLLQSYFYLLNLDFDYERVLVLLKTVKLST